MNDKDRLRQLVLGDDALAAYSKTYPDAVDRLIEALDAQDPILQALGESVVASQDVRAEALSMVLSDQFGLTQAEAAIGAALCGGMSLRDIATARGVAVTTVRNQVKSIMAKTSVRRQAELVSRLRSYL